MVVDKMKRKEAYKILTNQNTIIIDYTTGTINKQWKEAYDIAVNNLLTTQNLIQKNKTYKGILQKQNEIIDAMAEEFISKTLMYSDKTKQEVREHFERK